MANLIENRKARFSYEIQEKFEAGLVLIGSEVKSLKNHSGNLSGAYIIIRGKEAFLVGAEIPPYQPKNASPDYDPKRNRKLLLSRKEISKLAETESERGLTLVPLAVYNNGRNLKISFAVARGKRTRDKRETIRRREDDRKINRTLKKMR